MKRLVSMFACLLLVAVVSVELVTVIQDNQGFLRSARFQAAHNLGRICACVDEIATETERPDAEGRATPPDLVASWREFLARSASGKYNHEIASFAEEHVGPLTVFEAKSNFGEDEGDLLRVAVLSTALDRKSYLVMLDATFKQGGRHPRVGMLFSPSTPDRVYVSELKRDSDVERLFWDTVDRVKWSEPFLPDARVWKETLGSGLRPGAAAGGASGSRSDTRNSSGD